MSITKKESPSNTSSRPACMPCNKEDGFLPPINLRGTPSSDSDADYRRDQNGRLLLSNENSSLTPSPVKFPSIGRSISSSVSSLTSNRRNPERRELLCRSPSCPSNIGSITRFEFSPEEMGSLSAGSKDESEVKLPSIFQDNKKTCCSYMTPRTSRRKKNRNENDPLTSREASPEKHIAEKIVLSKSIDYIATPRDDMALDTSRGTQCALLLPLRNTETRKSKRKRRNAHYKQNTQASVKLESAVSDENSARDIIIPGTCSDIDYSPGLQTDGNRLSGSENVDTNSENNHMHTTYHVKNHPNKHQMIINDLAKVKA